MNPPKESDIHPDPAGSGSDAITPWTDRREARTIPTRRTLLQVLRDRAAAAGTGDPVAVALEREEAVIDLAFYRAVDRK